MTMGLPTNLVGAPVVSALLVAGQIGRYSTRASRPGGSRSSDTGLRHGFLYRPLSEWMGPVIRWARSRDA